MWRNAGCRWKNLCAFGESPGAIAKVGSAISHMTKNSNNHPQAQCSGLIAITVARWGRANGEGWSAAQKQKAHERRFVGIRKRGDRRVGQLPAKQLEEGTQQFQNICPRINHCGDSHKQINHVAAPIRVSCDGVAPRPTVRSRQRRILCQVNFLERKDARSVTFAKGRAIGTLRQTG